LVLSPAFLQATPVLTVAAFEAVIAEVVVNNRPRVVANTALFNFLELLTIFISLLIALGLT
jgi:hypothetical protein